MPFYGYLRDDDDDTFCRNNRTIYMFAFEYFIDDNPLPLCKRLQLNDGVVGSLLGSTVLTSYVS